ncbi:MAG: nitrate/nitrite transporter [Nitrospinota bacterium]
MSRHATLAAAWYLWFLTFGTRTAVSPVLPLVEDEFGMSHGEAGSLFTFIGAGYSILMVTAGFLVQRFGNRRVVLGAFGLVTLLFWAIPGAGDAFSLKLLFLLLGLASGAILPSLMPLLTRVYPRALWGRVLGIFDSAVGFSLIAMPLIARAVVRGGEWRRMYWTLGALAAVGWLLFAFAARGDEPAKGPLPRRPWSAYGVVLRNRHLLLLTLLGFCAASTSLGVYSLGPTYLVKGKGMPLDEANFWFALTRLPGLVVAVVGGMIADRWGARRTMGAILAVAGLFTIGVALAPTAGGVLLFLFLQNMVLPGFFPACFSYLAHVTTEQERSAALGLVLALGGSAASGLAPWFLGAVADAHSFELGILLVGLAAPLSSLLLLAMADERRGRNPP